MGAHEKTRRIVAAARGILEAHHPMTLRQTYYQLVSRQVIENNRGAYQAVSNALVTARREGIIPWEWLEDRLRRPRHVPMWNGLADYAHTVERAYRRDVWESQPSYLEVWLEKDALSGIFEDALRLYGVTLNVGRGYDGWSSIHSAAERYADQDVVVLYFGDFDPSGEDMVRSLKERIGACGAEPEIVKVALTMEDINRYSLPPDFTKATDTRSAAFVQKFGDVAVELDALPVDVLRERLETEVARRMDLDALQRTLDQEREDRARLLVMLRRG